MIKRFSPESPVSDIPGVGDTRKRQLEKLGIKTFSDLIFFFPRAYEDRGNVRLLSDVKLNEKQSLLLTVKTPVSSAMIRRGMTISKLKAFDESGECEVVFFNAPYVKDVFNVGDEFRFYGKVEQNRRLIQLTNPKYEAVLPNKELESLVPVYPLTDGLSSKFIDKITRFAIDEVLSSIIDPLPDDIRMRHSLPVLSYAIKNIHYPESKTALNKALKRLAFDEMMIFGIGIGLSSGKKAGLSGAPFSPCDITPLTSLLPYELTASQKNAVNEIYLDTVKRKNADKVAPMTRILVGDVGSGKTVCAIIAIYVAAMSGYQSALMVPTEILARQHYQDVKKLFDKLSIPCELLLGSTSQKEKKRIYTAIRDGETKVVIGTHALLSDKIEFSDLGLIVTDEQHRFGVAQRAVLKDKSNAAHMLVMSATPIPRTLALTMYGDLDVSRITEMPRGRMRVDTFVVDDTYRERLNSFISKQVENGGQCYIVCPAIEPCEEDEISYSPTSLISAELQINSHSNLKNVLEYTDILKQSLPNLKIEHLHGKLKASEKDEIMKRFASGETSVLVSTTVIEVGVNVPNATLMIIEDADRFGLSQLHQLRGRVGRGTKKSYCVLVSNSSADTARTRLEIMRTTYDGFEIAEKDLIMRGPGDFFATLSEEPMRQSGGFEFKLAKLCDDSELFEKAFSSAKEIIEKDPGLILPCHEELRREVMKYIAPITSTIS